MMLTVGRCEFMIIRLKLMEDILMRDMHLSSQIASNIHRTKNRRRNEQGYVFHANVPILMSVEL